MEIQETTAIVKVGHTFCKGFIYLSAGRDGPEGGMGPRVGMAAESAAKSYALSLIRKLNMDVLGYASAKQVQL